MIAYGCSITSPEAYVLHAGRGIDRVREPGAAVFPYQAGASLARVYNLVLEHAAEHDDLEALVLVHQDAELVDPGLPDRVRALLADPSIGVIGAVGSTGAGSMAWWEGDVRWSGCALRYGDFGGGDLREWPDREPARRAAHPDGEVDQLYGVVLVLSPWAVRTLRFDEGLPPVHGHDHDFSRQVRAAGRRLVTAPLGVVHHHRLELVADLGDWSGAHQEVQAKWDDREGEPDVWRARAREAEAYLGTGHLLVSSRQLQADALHLLERRTAERVQHTRGWQLTRPLRDLGELARRARARAGDA